MWYSLIRNYVLTTTLILLTGLIFTGCSDSGASVATTPGADISGKQDDAVTGSHRMLWGMWSVQYDAASGSFEVIPLRGAMLNLNAVLFLQPPVAPMDLVSIQINPPSNLANGYVDIDVTLRHPYVGVKRFRGFDVRGIVMAEGSIPLSFDNTAVHAGPDDMRLLNADGWTRWWNPTEFTTYDKIFGYTPGKKAYAGYYASAIINPYKYFADALDKGAPLSNLDLASRGTFATSPGINTRRYILQFPKPAGTPDYRFNYAVDASWAQPNNNYAPEFPLEAFSTKANMQEAWQVGIDDSGSTAWYINDSNKGGYLRLAVEVFDWQGGTQPGGVADETSAIWVDSAVLPGPVNILPLAAPVAGGPGSSIWDVDITDLNLTASGDFDIWVGVQASYPSNYAPQSPGIDPTSFDWPDVPLRAYMKGTVHISDTPGVAPEVLKVLPSKGEVSTVVPDLQIIGNNFLDGASVEFRYDPSTTLNVSNITWINSGLIKCDVDCTGPLGFYDVTVTNPDMQKGTLKQGFEVVEYFECTGDAHDWEGQDFDLGGVAPAEFYRFDTAIIRKGPYQGLALLQTSYSNWALFDPDAGAGQTVQPFITTPGMLIMDIEICETTGRMAFLSQFNAGIIHLYDEEGNELGLFTDPNLDATTGTFTSMDFDKYGDMWAVTKSGTIGDDAIFEIRHYKLLGDDPFYAPVIKDTVDITEVAMTGPIHGYGIGDIGISFYLHRLFVFSASHKDGGSNKLTSWDLNQSPPALLAELQDPYPPFTRHNIFGNTGALSRMEVEVDHRFPEDKYEQCRIYLFASVFTGNLDHYIIRLDGDLKIFATGSKYTIYHPFDFDEFPQCAPINDWGPSASGDIISIDWNNPRYVVWPVPGNW